ncbi:hypothetical protein TRFO_24068 [Tritrichomonas foetus]|uniref:Uncharacterized protein n=1 Tax=Tritrichomonas foetus TaxID=1144522 RepID=A0A1J4K8W7_9EUKA|nr:hypothetical protein TRFO_24068 [Tritrichomonas foetus]|eukprot:OHT07659.1 hypothetical protein TRFO_24068 [Tritrichomonas foetus]
MIIYLLTNLVICQTYEISERTMKKITLKNDDELRIIADNSDILIHVQSHFFFGKLSLTINNLTTKTTWEMTGKPKDRLFLKNCQANIKYSETSNTCTLTIWVLEAGFCDLSLIHASGVSSVQLLVDQINPIPQQKECFFFEFKNKPNLTSDEPTRFLTPTLISVSNGTLNYTLLSQAVTDETISKLSILKIERTKSKNIDYNFQLKSKQYFVDFTDNVSFFNNCNDGYCQLWNFTQTNLTYSQKVEWWIWTILYLAPSTFILLVVLLLIVPKKPETSLFSSTKPLLSENPGYK